MDAAGRRAVNWSAREGEWFGHLDDDRPRCLGVYFALAGEADSRSGGSGKMVILR